MKQFKERLGVNIGHKLGGIGFDLERQSQVIRVHPEYYIDI